MLPDSLPQIFDKIKVDLSNNELFSKNNPDAEDYTKLTEMIMEVMLHAGGKILAQTLQENQPKQNELLVNGEKYVFKEVVSKTFLTKLGEVTVARRVYRSQNGKTYVPLDESWGTDGEYSDAGLREMIAYLVASNTPSETEEIFKRFTNVKPSQDYIRKVADRVGRVMESCKEDIQKDAQDHETIDSQAKVVAFSLDGANTPIREKGNKARRPAFRPKSVKKNMSVTKKNRAKSSDKLQSAVKSSPSSETSSNDDQKNCCYKNVMVATVTFYGEKKPEQQTPQHLGSIYLAQMPEKNYPTLKHHFEVEVKRFSQDKAIQKVFIADGAPHIWKYKSETRELDGSTEILDYYHATEQLNVLAESLFGETSSQAKSWYNKYSSLLLTDSSGAKKMFRSAKYHQKKKSRSKSLEKIVQRELKYFRKNLSRMTYFEFRNRGLPIGSGPVEAACKTIVKARLCGSGMRWSLPGGQHVLNLRVMRKSHRWDTAWKLYLKNRNNKNIIPV